MSGWRCPVCGSVWAPSVVRCPESHGLASNSANVESSMDLWIQYVTGEKWVPLRDVEKMREGT